MPLLLSIASALLLLTALVCCILTYKNKISFFAGVILSAGAVLLSTLANIYKTNLLSGADIITEVIDESFNSVSNFISSLPPEQLMKMFGRITSETSEAMRGGLLSSITQLKEIYLLLFPSVLILNILATSYFVYMLIKQVLRLLKKDVSKYPDFSQLILKPSASAALVASYILSFVVGGEKTAAAFSNIAVIVGGVAFVCGLSFVDFKMRKKIKSAWLRLPVYIAFAFVSSAAFGFLFFVLILIAVFDSFADYRRLRGGEIKNDGQ